VRQAAGCEVLTNLANGTGRVEFSVDGRPLNIERYAPYNCVFDSTRVADGTHTLKAVAFDRSGRSTARTLQVLVDNVPDAPADTTGPALSWAAPVAGATVSGSLSAGTCEVRATDAGGVDRVVFSVDGIPAQRRAPRAVQLRLRHADRRERRPHVARDRVRQGRQREHGDGAGPGPERRAAPAPAPAPAPTTTTAAAPAPSPSTGPAATRPVGSPVLGDATAAGRVRRSTWEPRPQNADENRRIPTADELAGWRRAYQACGWGWSDVHNAHLARVTGNPTLSNPTTDELIQWTAHKWGIDEDLVRSMAVNESTWDMAMNGDGGLSWGITQVKLAPFSPCSTHPGTHPLSRQSTSFNLDYWGAYVRSAFDGGTDWLGSGYRSGDIWGSMGAWFSGDWYSGSQAYIDAAKGHHAAKPWTRPGF
jgi:autotransporter family porin